MESTVTATAAGPVPATEVVLTQAAYHAFAFGLEAATKVNSQLVIMHDSNLFTFATGRWAAIQADYKPLITQPLSLAIVPDKTAVKNLRLIRGEGDVRMIKGNDGLCHFCGDHMQVSLQTRPMPAPETFALPGISWIGTELSEYDPKDLKAIIGKKSSEVQLAVYDEQIEQLGINGRGRYTFTANMDEPLAGRRPNHVLLSRVAFRIFGSRQALRLGKVGDQFVLRATNSFDIGVDLVITEHLDIVSGR